jgi:hypothetical protein
MAALVAGALALLPDSLRRRFLGAAFDRARDAFNRGDLEALFALFHRDVEYVPPPALHEGDPDLREPQYRLERQLGTWASAMIRSTFSGAKNFGAGRVLACTLTNASIAA